MLELALAAGWGLALGAFNHWLVARPLARLQQGGDPAQAQALARKIYGLFLVRTLVSLAGLGAAFLIWQTGPGMGAVLGGLLVANGLSIWQNHRRKSRLGSSSREGTDG